MADSNITKKALADALKNLMKSREFEKISVSEICEECGMNRKSFYYHFKDKYDLVDWIFYDSFLSSLQVAAYETGWDAMEDLCRVFYDDREFYVKALMIEGQNSFHDYVLETIGPLVSYFTKDIFDGLPERDFFYTFFADAFLHIIMRWLKDEKDMAPREFIRNLQDVMRGLLRAASAGNEERSAPE